MEQHLEDAELSKVVCEHGTCSCLINGLTLGPEVTNFYPAVQTIVCYLLGGPCGRLL